MSYVLNKLSSKNEIDNAIRHTEDKVLVLRFGRENEADCMVMDDILAKTVQVLSKMAEIYIVPMNNVPIYVKYFNITFTPATVFFFNGQHMKVDYGTPDHTKFIGSFKTKQDFIDLVEVLYRGAMRGKLIVTCPIDSKNIPKYDLLYKDV